MGEYWGAIKTVFIFPSGEVIGHAPKEYHKIWLGTVTWSRMDERKKLRTLLVAASGGEQEVSELHYRNKFEKCIVTKKITIVLASYAVLMYSRRSIKHRGYLGWALLRV